jgi:hypothetical protein
MVFYVLLRKGVKIKLKRGYKLNNILVFFLIEVSNVTSGDLSFNHPPPPDLAHFSHISDLQVECSGVLQLLPRCGGKVCLVDASEESGLNFGMKLSFFI